MERYGRRYYLTRPPRRVRPMSLPSRLSRVTVQYLSTCSLGSVSKRGCAAPALACAPGDCMCHHIRITSHFHHTYCMYARTTVPVPRLTTFWTHRYHISTGSHKASENFRCRARCDCVVCVALARVYSARFLFKKKKRAPEAQVCSCDLKS